MSVTTDAEYLPAAITALDDAIHDLIKVQTMRDADGQVYTAPNLYVQLKTALHGQQSGEGKSAFRSRPSVWIAGLDLVERIERTVAEWAAPHRGHTLSLLADLPHMGWRPQDSSELQKWALTIRGWVKTINNLLDGVSEVEVTGACPQCEAKTVWRRDDLDENVKQPALLVTAQEARCLSCGTVWPPTSFELLAAAIGCAKVA
ncbi:hypothetical protein RhoFasB10_03772 [Rhodococcus sp. B10]|nr:hypothetical protein [Rhodococcus sp. B10]